MGKEERSKANSDLKKTHTVRKSSRREQALLLSERQKRFCLQLAKAQLKDELTLMNSMREISYNNEAVRFRTELGKRQLTMDVLKSVIKRMRELNRIKTQSRLTNEGDVYTASTELTENIYATILLLERVYDLLQTPPFSSENCKNCILEYIDKVLHEKYSEPRSRGSTRHKRAKRKNTRRNKTSH